SAPALPHAVPLHHLHRHRGMLRSRAVAAAAARDVGQHRHAARVRAGVRRRMDPATYATRSGAAVPYTARPPGAAARHPLLSGPHAHTAARHVDPLVRVASDRIRRLFWLLPETQRAAVLDYLL